MLTIHRYSHFIKIKPTTEEERKICTQFSLTLISFKFESAGGGNTVRVPDKVYAASNKLRTEFRFHRNSLENFIQYLKSKGYTDDWYEIQDHPFTPKRDVHVELKIKEGWIPRDYQIPVIKYVSDNNIKPNHLVNLATGQGKQESVDNHIRIPDGWKRMGDIKPNDDVIAWDGTTAKVTSVYPQGMKDVYKLTVRDGRSIEVGKDHLWTVYTDHRNQKNHDNHPLGAKYTDMTTGEIKSLLDRNKDYRIYLPLNKSEQNKPKNFLIDPYILGVLIGDGCISSGNVQYCKPDVFISEEIARRLPEGLIIRKTPSSPDSKAHWSIVRDPAKRLMGKNAFKTELERLGLMGKRAWEKFIPEEYMNGSTEQRLDLVRGLLDTDGYVDENGGVEYSTTSEKLIHQFRELIFSLGGQATFNSRVTKYTDKEGNRVPGRESYRTKVRHPKPSSLFLLPRKKERLNDNNQYSPTLKLRVKSVEKMDYQKEMQCISIDHPDQLYITKDYLVTHNTFCALMAAGEMGLRSLYLLRPAFIDKWVQDVKNTYEIEDDDIVTVRGGAQLMALLAYAANPKNVMPKVIILSNKTYQNYLKQYEEFGEELLELGYDCLPEDLYEHLGVGIRYIDEVHLDYHLNFKADLYTNVYNASAFSASLIDSDPFMKRMYALAYPVPDRYKAPPPKKYIEAKGVMYKLVEGRNPKYTWRGRKEYSHGAYEQYLIKKPAMLANYLAMVKEIADNHYRGDEYREGDRLLIFCYSIDMATILTNYFKEQYSDLTVERYVEDDEYKNVMEPDVRISTVLSAGTGIDIKKLKVAILTTAISSEKSNIQALGRLRELKDDDRPPYFFWLTCENIPKHLDYHRRKIELFKDRTKTVGTVYYDKRI